MKYYLVGLFDLESYNSIEKLQIKLSEKYKLYNKLPKLHVTLEVIDSPDLKKLNEILKSLFKNTEKFNVSADGAICFEPPYKSVNLKIINEGILKQIVNKINITLKNEGFNARENIDNWDMHVSLANSYFSTREWSQAEYISACELTKYYNLQETLIIDKIQLWEPINDDEKMVINEYLLK